MFRFSLFACLAPALAAIGCSPIDSSRIGGAPSTANDYETLASQAALTSTLGGVALKTRENPDSVTISTSSGALRHDTGAIRIDDGTYVIADPDGFDQGGLLSDGFSILIATPAQGFSSNYDYAFVYNQAYVSAGTPYSVTGVTGIVTRADDMPSSGSASYSGEARGSFANATDSFDLEKGTSTVIANFKTGNVAVSMTGFQAKNRSTGTAADVGFNGIDINGMRISGNGFSGGSIITLLNGTNAAAVGTRRSEQASGRFYGSNGAGVPDEVGGIGYLRGSDGAVRAIFLAD